MISASMDKASVREFKRALKEYEKAMGVSIEDGIIDMAQSTCRRLAHTVPPFGLSSAVGKKFQESIGAQVDYAWTAANRGLIPSSSIEQAHAAARNHRGQVRMKKLAKGKPVAKPITVGEKEAYKRKIIRRAGRAKAGYLAAAQKIKALRSSKGGKKASLLSGVAKWIKDNVKEKFGESQTRRDGMGTMVAVTNAIDYIQHLHKSSMVERAIEQGRRNGIKRMRHIIDKTKRTV